MTSIEKVDFYISIDGSTIDPAMSAAVEMFEVDSTLHKPSMATITLYDPDLVYIDQSSIEPGKALVIQIGSPAKDIFDGEIVEIEPEFTNQGARLLIRAFDRMHRLSHGDHTRSFQNVKVSDLVKKLAGEVGLQSAADATASVHPHLLQTNQTNLAFLQAHAAWLGMYLSVKQSTLQCKKFASTTEATLEWNVDLTSFRPRLRGIAHMSKVTVKSWDVKTKNVLVGQASTPTTDIMPKIGTVYKNHYSYSAETLISDCRLETQDDATKLAQAELDRHTSQFIEADGSCYSNPAVLAGVTLNIRNVGTRFSGKYIVTQALHRYTAAEGLTTEFRVSGMNPDGLLAHLLPQVEQPALGVGLMVGVVTNNNDPKHYGRVKLKLPWLSDYDETDWARVVGVGGGKERGLFVLPEVNDEVLVGFEQGDLNRPYVLGGLWNGKDSLPISTTEAVVNGEVVKRVFHSRSGHKITIDDSKDKAGISIIDKTGNNKIVITSSDNKLEIATDGDITVTTQANATVTATGDIKVEASGALGITSTGDMSLKSNGNITIDAAMGLSLKSTGDDLTVEAGTNLNASANIKATLKGNAGVDVTSSAITNIKGSLLNLN